MSDSIYIYKGGIQSFCWLHKWVVPDKYKNSVNKYQHCTKCNTKRIITNSRHGYQPVDLDFLKDA